MDEKTRLLLKGITDHSKLIITGDYNYTEDITKLTVNPDIPPEVSELCESFGMMSVKVEARELSLEQKIEELHQKNMSLEKAKRLREEFSLIFVMFVFAVSVHSFLTAIINELRTREIASSDISVYGTLIVMVLFFIFAGIYIKKFKIPLYSFGLTTVNAKKSIKESLLLTIIMLIIMILIKWYAIINHFEYKNTSLLEFHHANIFTLSYIIVAPLQEFLARGVIQGSVQRFLYGKYSDVLAIVTTSFLFGLFHTHYNINLGILTLILGLVWGWLYARHRTIIGISISHFILGVMAEIIGVWQYIS